MIISIIDIINPYFFVIGKNNKTEIAISTIGSNHERTNELVANSGDFDNTT